MIGPTGKPWAERVNRREKAVETWAGRHEAGPLAFAVSTVAVLGAFAIPMALAMQP